MTLAIDNAKNDTTIKQHSNQQDLLISSLISVTISLGFSMSSPSTTDFCNNPVSHTSVTNDV